MRQAQSRKKKGADVEPAEKAVCHDTGGIGYTQHRFVQWGDDPRFQRCSRCGTINAEGLSSEAKYPREKQPERPRKHYHTFVPCAFDPRYERCFCGAVCMRVAVVGGAA